jgi:two-component system sensor histidine kinase VicK
MVMTGVLPSTNYTNDTVTLIIVSLWLFLGLYYFLIPLQSREDASVRFVTFSGMTLATLLFVTGFFQPLLIGVLLLLLLAHLYFGYRGLAMTLSVIIMAAVTDALLRFSEQPDILPQNTMAIIALLVMTLVLIALLNNRESRQQALVKSRHQERLQYDRILTIINNLNDATFSTSSSGVVQLYNAAALNLLDTNDSMKGKNIDSLFTLTDNDGTKIHLLDLVTATDRTTRRSDIRHTYPDGEEIRLELSFAPIKSSFGIVSSKKTDHGYIIIARDVTKEKSLEEERDEFISVVSHELRTPITIVEGTLSNLQFLMDRSDATDPKMIKSTVQTAHDQIIYLARMVNDLSTLSRAERGVADTPEPIDVADMVHALHTQYSPEAGAKGLELNLDLGTKLGSITASRLYTEELLQNFITNAIKYTKTGSVCVTVRKRKGSIYFGVKDTGIGISRSDQAKVFHKFYRSEDYRIRETNGTGLGLYVSAKLAHKLGTQINLTSRLNHGSTFSFELPAND